MSVNCVMFWSRNNETTHMFLLKTTDQKIAQILQNYRKLHRSRIQSLKYSYFKQSIQTEKAGKNCNPKNIHKRQAKKGTSIHFSKHKKQINTLKNHFSR